MACFSVSCENNKKEQHELHTLAIWTHQFSRSWEPILSLCSWT